MINESMAIARPCPPVQQFDHIAQFMVMCHSILFVLACIGNVTMFLILCNNLFHKSGSIAKKRGSRIYILLLHMNIADLIVTFEHLPKEMIHTLMVGWYGGDFLCKLCKFLDVFGIFLSSNILICMCLDRCFSVYVPLSSLRGRQRVQRMVVVAWLAAGLISLPQFAIWQTAIHPCVKTFSQCMSKDFLGLLDPRFVLAYTILTAVQSYFLPLLIVIFCYSLIFLQLHSSVETQKNVTVRERSDSIFPNGYLLRRKNTLKHSKNAGTSPPATPPHSSSSRLIQTRASSVQLINLQRARSKTLQMTLSIVLFFIICWTPYYVAVTVHFFDINYSTGRPSGNLQIPKMLTKLLYLFAVVNSSLNPYVYGYFSFDLRKELCNLFHCLPVVSRYLGKQEIIGKFGKNLHLQQNNNQNSLLDTPTHFTTLLPERPEQ